MPASKITVLNNFLDVVKYCKTYDEWPKFYTRDIGDKEKLSNRLYRWLFDNGFNREGLEFTYKNFKTEDGTSIGEVLEELYLEYAPEIKMAHELENYCKEHGRLPRLYHLKGSKNFFTDDERLSNRLYVWIRDNGLIENSKDDYRLEDYEMLQKNEVLTLEEFKWLLVVEKVKEIYEAYGSAVKGSVRSFVSFMDRLERYCVTYNAWPTRTGLKISEEEKNESDFLYKKLDYFGFKNKTGKLTIPKVVNGKDYTEKIESLFQKYATNITGSKAYIESNIANVMMYCTKYYEWPKRKSDTKAQQNVLATNLACWLSKAGYPYNFIYKDYKFSNGMTAKEVLDTYYKVFAKFRNKIVADDNCKNFNSWVQKSSKDRATALFTYAALMRLNVISGDVKKFEFYRDNFNDYLKANNINFDAQNLERLFKLSNEEQEKYFDILAEKCAKIGQNDVSQMFEKLAELLKQISPKKMVFLK